MTGPVPGLRMAASGGVEGYVPSARKGTSIGRSSEAPPAAPVYEEA